MDFWDEQAGADVVETEPVNQDIPAKKWYVGKTAHGSGAVAKLRSFNGKKDPSKTYHVFATGFVVHGVEQGVDPRYNGRYCFGEWFIHPHPKEVEERDGAGAVVSSRFLGVLNAIFSPGVGDDIEDKKERSRLRWQNTLKVLRARAEILGRGLEDYQGDGAVFIAQMAAEELADEARFVLFYTKENERTFKDGTKKNESVVTSLRDCTAETLADTKRNFQQTNEDDYPIFAAPAPTTPGDTF
jgi:hypothetical protein